MNILDFKNQANKTDCLILGCGPSLNDFSEEKLRAVSKDKTVFAIKQAFLRVPDLIDFHFVNDNNYQPYEYTGNTCVLSELPRNSISGEIIERSHYTFLVSQNWDYFKSLSYLLNFDDWIIEKSPIERPWGPGIMYELVFFFAHLLGCKRLYTIGWDLGPPEEKTRRHYYEHKVINPAAQMSPDESKNEVNLTRAFWVWLESQGIELYVGSNNSFVHEDVPRIQL